MNSDFYEDRRYCPSCASYRRYLQAPEDAYCVGCGGRVTIYSKEDLGRVLRTGSPSWNASDDGAILRERVSRGSGRGSGWRARTPGRR